MHTIFWWLDSKWRPLPLCHNHCPEKKLSFLKWANPSLFSVYFWSFQTNYNVYVQQINVKNVQMSIQYTAPGIKPTTFQTWVVTHNHYTRAFALSLRFFIQRNVAERERQLEKSLQMLSRWRPSPSSNTFVRARDFCRRNQISSPLMSPEYSKSVFLSPKCIIELLQSSTPRPPPSCSYCSSSFFVSDKVAAYLFFCLGRIDWSNPISYFFFALCVPQLIQLQSYIRQRMLYFKGH